MSTVEQQASGGAGDDDSSDEDLEDHFEEGFLDAVTKTGVIERVKDTKDAKDKDKHKFYFYLLAGGTLFEYRTIKHTDPKETFNLKGCEVTETSQPISTSLELRKDGKVLALFLFQSHESRAEWAKVLRASLDKDPRPAPKRVKAAKGTLKMRMKKTLAGKVAISGAGKLMAKAAVPEEVQRLINSLRVLLQTHIGEQEAIEVEDHIIKLYVKCFCLEEDGQIKMEDFMQMDQPMRQAFGAISKLRDQTIARKPEAVAQATEGIKKIQGHLRDTEVRLTTLLTPHLKPHTISKIAIIFKFIADPVFLRKSIVAPLPGQAQPYTFLEDEIDNLCSAMDKYLSVHYYQEEH